ncbi:hypothetical protein TH61_03045 [Rufibacter sp. DG15C]|uniref:hypothetical protein n=1 Tax=Rufibacter sp. DG15C TaxID=1379909 RepID=UPI00078E8AFB|nr:hypothetical protein [Rufibacter sp. DG15C]AMM50360.1 hypothetical protein TH61_03045 [Rufibacter sp. DG15C]
MEGIWDIEAIHYNEYDIRGCLLGSIFRFKDEYVTLPVTLNCSVLGKTRDRGTWEVIEPDSGGFLLKIDSESKVFNGTHRLRFIKDFENKMLKFEITSDSLYIVGNKVLYPFKSNINNIDYLVKLSK